MSDVMSDVMFLELWGKKCLKNFKGYYLNNDYLAELCELGCRAAV